ncbi:hypothetical protein HDU79_006989 [Rhizoclosmatium sp. JEL0117]|nr:hypothetical protein HDU79_006989 [Rhizoclosmatium sp. JEL0117]
MALQRRDSDVQQKLASVKAALETVSFGELALKVMTQNEQIAELKEQTALLADNIQRQESIISRLKNANKVLQQRALEVLDFEEPLDVILHGVQTELAQRTNPQKEDENILNNVNGLIEALQRLKMAVDTRTDGRQNSAINVPVDIRISRRTTLKPTRIVETESPIIQSLLIFPLLASFPWDALQLIASTATNTTATAGKTIMSKGEEGSNIYFLTEGVVSVLVGEGTTKNLGSPTFFGEIGVLSKAQQCTATIIAKTNTIMICVAKSSLVAAAETFPTVRKLIDEFRMNAELWWKQQQYVVTEERYGKQFMDDLARKGIKKLDVFSEAPEEFINSLAATMAVLEFQANTNIISINDKADCMYFILRGTVQVIGETGVVHAEMDSGNSFGEVGILLNMNRTASIRAKYDCTVFQLTRENLSKAVVTYPIMKEKLKAAADERLALFKMRTTQAKPDQFDIEVGEQSLSKLTIFDGVDQSVISEMAAMMVRKTWKKGDVIIKCGDTGMSMFFLAAGTVDVISEFGELLESVSGPSAYFGEVALLEHVPRIATIKCTSTSSTFELTKADVSQVLKKYPEIAQHIKETAHNRMQQYLMRNTYLMSTSLDSVLPADQELGFVAATIDNKSVSVLSEKVLDYEETIRQLREQIKTLTHERDDMLKYIKSTNEMVLNLIKNVENKDGTANTFQVASQLLQLQSSLKKPEELVPTLEKELTPLESQYASESLVRKNTRGHVTVLRDKDKKDTLQMLQKESAQYHPYISILQRFPLFATFPRHILEKVSLAAYEMTRKKGQLIVTKGEEGAEIFFILSGMVSIFVEDTELSSLQQPVFFGELGVLFKFRRTATVVAKTDITMIVVTRQKLDDIISTSPEVQKMVDEFSANKEIWWLKQQYASGSEKFGSEFANDIARKNIRRLDLFKDAPDAFIDSLAMTTTCLVIQDSQNIVNIGEESDAMYFLLAGVVQVVGDTGVVHAEITAGSFFGEVGVLLNMKRTASIRAKGECYVFKLTKENLDRVVLDHPVMSEKLHAEAAERLALFKARTQETTDSKTTAPDQFDMEIGENALTKLSLFRGVDQNVIQELAISMVRKTWNTGEKIIQCGDTGDSMFFLAAGTANVITEFGEIIDDVSGPSAYFGEVAIMEEVPRTATIKCTSECSTYELRKNDVKLVMSKYPDIATQLKETADERMQKYLMRNVLA